MRYLFRGLLKETAAPVEGHVEADNPEAAYWALGENGIITESLREDPAPLNVSSTPAAIPEVADALESALDSSSSQVSFDDLTERYRGKKVWVIDRDKIRQRVAQIVDSTLAASEANLESAEMVRQRVANAIRGLFLDTRNIASERNADSIAGARYMGPNQGLAPQAPQPAQSQPVMDAALEQQIGRLTGVVQQAEALISAMSTALRNTKSSEGGNVPRRMQVVTPKTLNALQDEVLREIFQSNLELRRAVNVQAAPEAEQAIQTSQDPTAPIPEIQLSPPPSLPDNVAGPQ